MLPEQLSPQFLKRLELLQLRSRRSFLGTRQGGHVSTKRGHGMEFSDYRQYELGDNPRHIDWGVYGRSDKLYVKRFQEEQEISVLVMLDNSASLFAGEASTSKWVFASNLALSIAYVTLMQQDTAVLSLSDGSTSPKLMGPRAIHTGASFLAKASPYHSPSVQEGLRRAVNRLRFPGVAILISDFLFEEGELMPVIKSILAKNFDCTFIQVLSPEDLEPPLHGESNIAVDIENKEEVQISITPEAQTQYSYLFSQHQQRVRALALANNIRFISTTSNRSLSDFIAQDISRSGLLSK